MIEQGRPPIGIGMACYAFAGEESLLMIGSERFGKILLMARETVRAGAGEPLRGMALQAGDIGMRSLQGEFGRGVTELHRDRKVLPRSGGVTISALLLERPMRRTLRKETGRHRIDGQEEQNNGRCAELQTGRPHGASVPDRSY